MKISSFFVRVACALGCLGLAAAGARDQGVWNYSGPIYSFGSRAFARDGASPNGGVVVSPDGKTLYGTTYSGGKSNLGTVFAFHLDNNGQPSGPPITRWDFGNGFFNGAHPQGNLVLANGILYGTTLYGGSFGNGSVYRIGADGLNPPYSSLWYFSSEPIPQIPGHPYDGNLPSYAGLTLSSDGTILHGTTMFGGDNDKGAVFAIGGAAHYQLLHQFTVGFPDDGSFPQAALVLSADGQTLYGTTSAGGNNDNGTVFAVSTIGDVNGTYTVLDPHVSLLG